MTTKSYTPRTEMARLMDELGLRQVDLAEMSGHTAQTINAWAKGRAEAPTIMLQYLRALVTVQDLERRQEATGKLVAHVREWLDQPFGQ